MGHSLEWLCSWRLIMFIHHFCDWQNPNSLHEENKKQMDRPVSVSTSYFIFHVAYSRLLNLLQMQDPFDTVYLLWPVSPPAFFFALWETPLFSSGWWLVGWATTLTFLCAFSGNSNIFHFWKSSGLPKKKKKKGGRKGKKAGECSIVLSTLLFVLNIKQAAAQILEKVVKGNKTGMLMLLLLNQSKMIDYGVMCYTHMNKCIFVK